ncbi:MAG: elongation factor P maturation arginine rhamnosyltransferase EarP [Burkholderiales bacterium]|nr:elongation factor P maturation arginine rhamnosyltransferase EarP [Burkholderiales bacterium]
MKAGNLWDIFCRVVDNYGDVGVCWRLAADLAARGEQVRLWLDDPSALAWLAPDGAPGVTVKRWNDSLQPGDLSVGDVLIEAFGCEVDAGFLAACAQQAADTGHQSVWLNLEYLSAEAFVERCHGLPSPVLAGPAKGLRKYFFYPGFTPATGGLLREADLAVRQASFDREAWLRRLAIPFQGERLVSLFCYEPTALPALLEQLAADEQPTRLLVTPGRATAAVQACLACMNSTHAEWKAQDRLKFTYLPALSQLDYDALLWSCDLNFVRGEDSLVRALWAGKPFVWQIYQQSDNAHQAKLDAFLDHLQAPPSLRTFHQVWNGLSQAALPQPNLTEWQRSVSSARARQLQDDDLVTKIIRFVRKNR